jgi:hypothetical protein
MVDVTDPLPSDFDVDFAKLPPVLPATVARTEAESGLATKELLDWEQYTRDWFKRTAVNLQRRSEVVEASFEDAYAGFREEIVALADADLAQVTQTTTLEARIGANEAELVNERIARTTRDSAFAGELTSFSTTVGAQTAQIQTVAASIDGVKVQYGVVGTIDGARGGFVFQGVKQLGGGVTFGLIIDANVVINGNLLVNGSIESSKLGVLSGMESDEKPDVTVPITTQAGGRVLILASVNSTGAQTGTFFTPVYTGNVSVPVYWNGSPIGTLLVTLSSEVVSYDTDGMPNGWQLRVSGGSSNHFVVPAPGGACAVHVPASSAVAAQTGGWGGLASARVSIVTIAK